MLATDQKYIPVRYNFRKEKSTTPEEAAVMKARNQRVMSLFMSQMAKHMTAESQL